MVNFRCIDITYKFIQLQCRPRELISVDVYVDENCWCSSLRAAIKDGSSISNAWPFPQRTIFDVQMFAKNHFLCNFKWFESGQVFAIPTWSAGVLDAKTKFALVSPSLYFFLCVCLVKTISVICGLSALFLEVNTHGLHQNDKEKRGRERKREREAQT